MKSRTLPLVMLLLSVLILLFASVRTGARLLDSSLFRLESNLLYIIISAVALGALLMFVIVSFFPVRQRQAKESRLQLGISSSVVTAEAAIHMGNWEKATHLLTQIPENHPDYWYGKKISGDLALQKGSWLEAESFYQTALRFATGSNRALVFFALGELFDQQENSEPAQAHYEEAMRIDSSAFEPVWRLRLHAIRNQEWSRALQWQEHLEQHFSKQLLDSEEETMKAGIRYELAASVARTDACKTALALVKYVMRLSGTFTPAYLLAGNLQEKLENPSAALKAWEKGFQATGHPVFLIRIGEFFLSQDTPEKAIEYFRTIVGNFPSDPFVHYCLGDLYLKLEMTNEAIGVFERLQQTNPNWFFIRLILAELRHRIGRDKDASQIYEDILNSGEPITSLPWQCYSCNTTYGEYRSFCNSCYSWNSINLNQQKAVNTGMQYEKPAALPY